MPATRPDAPLVVVVDDDDATRRACEAALGRHGYRVETFADGPSGLERVADAHPPLLVVDLKMPGMGGIEVINRVREIDPEVVIVVITGYATIAAAVDAMKAGAFDFLPKPFTSDELLIIIRRALRHHELLAEAARLRREREAQARRFITFVSHQLQSPIDAVRQYLDVLEHLMGDSVPEQARPWLARSASRLGQMSEIIQDWLTLSRVESGQVAARREPVDWAAVAARVVESHQLGAQAAEVTVQVDFPTALPPVMGDPGALEMLLSNLVSNAIKYNRPDGRVVVCAEAAARSVRITVSDTGIGVAPENVPRLFDEFYRVSVPATATVPGTGMGLPICRRIAEQLGGRVDLSSVEGQGTVVTVELPRAGGSDGATAATDGPGQRS